MIQRSFSTFRAKDRQLALGNATRIMGIINVTPDSFSGDGGLRSDDFVRMSLLKALKMVEEGADMIDIGGESTRPGAGIVSSLEECRRVVPVIEALSASGIKTMVSVDTSKAVVVKAALNAGAHVVNLVQSNKLSAGLLKIVRERQAGIILMHMRGTPRTMQQKIKYRHFWPDVLFELKSCVRIATQAGILRDRIIVDPGIGFAKTAAQNFLLIKELERLRALDLPVLIGPSRKSFLGSVLNTAPADRLFGSVAAVVAGVMNGAHIVRVHDVLQVKQAVSVADAILSGGK